jgi:hypothetical protein
MSMRTTWPSRIMPTSCTGVPYTRAGGSGLANGFAVVSIDNVQEADFKHR